MLSKLFDKWILSIDSSGISKEAIQDIDKQLEEIWLEDKIELANLYAQTDWRNAEELENEMLVMIDEMIKLTDEYIRQNEIINEYR